MSDETSFLYLDNAATSFPKPECVAVAMAEFLTEQAVNPGRSGYDLSMAVGQRVDRLRGDLVRFFGAPSLAPDRAVFTANATDALNLALGGVCRPGDHVVSTVIEHNSVLRPLHMLQQQGLISYDLAGCDPRGVVNTVDVGALIRPNTRLVVMTHASNVSGAVQPVAEVGALCRSKGILFLLDTAQTAGLLPVEMSAWGVDLLAFTGHKSLLGPTGTGGLLIGPEVPIRSTRWGGTGVRSSEAEHPSEFPYRLEAGTLNTVGLMGLAASLAWIAEQGQPKILAHEVALGNRFLAGCRAIPGLNIVGGTAEKEIDPNDRLPVISLTLKDLSPEAAGQFLDAEWNIAVRTGLHCAPLAHEALGTADGGTIRFSVGPFNTAAQIDRALCALEAIAGE
jgi:cysteine desulfurase / selenocysteine lyase